MATSINVPTRLVPTTSAPVTLYAGGDDMNVQKLIAADPVAASAVITQTASGAVTQYVDGLDFVLKSNHRPLGQRGSHRPQAVGRAQIKQEDGRVSTLSCTVTFAIENGVGLPKTDGTFDYNPASIVPFARALLVGNLQLLLNPTGLSGTDLTVAALDANLARLFRGIIVASA